MENPANPLLEMRTSAGEIYLEMLPAEAPLNVARVVALAAGEVEIFDADTGENLLPRYYDGLSFHRVIPDFVIQAASPTLHPLGGPGEALPNEVNADALGLDTEPVLNRDGTVNSRLNVLNQEDFADEVLRPLYQSMNIDDVTSLEDRLQAALDRLQEMTIKSLYELQGYSFSSNFPTRPIARGTLALVNSGPGSNGAEFFIALSDLPTLTGKYTVIGRVVEGMEVVDQIGTTAINPTQFSRPGTIITSLQQINGAEPD